MKNSATNWTRALVSTAGSVLAGPAGAVIGTLMGGLVASAFPALAGFAHDVATRLTARSIEKAGEELARRLSPEEKQLVNHDLQSAFRDSFREALRDLGGAACFPDAHDGGGAVPRGGALFPPPPAGAAGGG